MAKVNVSFGADLSGFSAGVDAARDKIQQFGSSIAQIPQNESFVSIAEDAAKVAAELSAAAFAVRAFSSSFDFEAAGANIAAGNFAALGTQLSGAAKGVAVISAQAIAARIALVATGAAALGAGIAFVSFANSVDEANKRITAVASATAFAGNLNKVEEGFIYAGQGTAQFLAQLEKIPGVSADAANGMQAQISSIHNYSTDLEKLVIDVLPAFASASGQKLPDAMASLTKALDDPLNTVKQFTAALPNASAAELAQADAAQRSGNVNQAIATIMAALTQRYAQSRTQVAALTAEQRNQAEAAAQVAAAEAGLDIAADVTATKLAYETSAIQQNIDKWNQRIAAQRAAAQTPEQIQFQSGRVVDQVQPAAQQMDALSGKISAVEARLSVLREQYSNVFDGGKVTDPTGEFDRLSQTLDKLKQQMTDLNNQSKGGGPVQLVDLNNATRGLQLGQDQLRDAQAVADATKQQAASDTDATRLTQDATAAARAQLAVQMQQLEITRSQNSLAKATSNQTDGQAALSQAKADQAAVNQVYAQGTKERIDAATAVANAQKAVDLESEQDQADKENQKYQNALNSSNAQIALIKQRGNEGQISRSQELSELNAALDQRTALERAHYETLKGIWDQGTGQYRQAVNQLAQIDTAAAAERLAVTRDVNQQMFNDYKKSFEQVGNSISSGIMGIIQGQQTIGQAAKNVTLSMIQSFLQARIRMVADWAAGQAAQLAATSATETAKTAAVTAGETARTGVVAAGAAAAQGLTFSSMITQILASAKETFAGIFGFLSPIMGPAAAGPAAAGEAAVAGMASFAVGSWALPSDMIAQVHQGEMIVPAAATPWAQSLMSNAAGGGNAGGGSNVAVNFSPVIYGSISQQTARSWAATLAKEMQRQMLTNPSMKFA